MGNCARGEADSRGALAPLASQDACLNAYQYSALKWHIILHHLFSLSNKLSQANRYFMPVFIGFSPIYHRVRQKSALTPFVVCDIVSMLF